MFIRLFLTVIVYDAVNLFTNVNSWTSTPTPIFGPIDLPKAPHWDADRQCLFFVSVYESTIHKYIPSTGVHTYARVGNEPIAFVIPIKGSDHEFIVSLGRNLAIVSWNGRSPAVESTNIWKPIGRYVYRANEGKVSPSGSLFVGGHSPFKADDSGIEMNQAALYVFNRNGQSKIALQKLTVANGMAWSKDQSMFYFIDSLAYAVYSYSYNVKDDSLTNENVLLNFQDAGIPGVPDGMAIDEDDNLWITSFEGHQVVKFDPKTRSTIKKIPLDAFQVTSVAFGGPSLNDFYVTTGKYKMNSTTLASYPHSGYIFEQKNFEATGRPGVPFTLQ